MLARSAALGLLAAAVSAFDASSSSNVAMYWGQGDSQISLKDLCNDPSVDIVNLAFVNQFPKQRGEFPSTNFANACDDVFYDDVFGNKSGLRSSCPSIPEGIKTCRNNGKKVLLSIGGGAPIDYYLETRDIAEYLADFLWGAFGPSDDDWLKKGLPRPFGDQWVDGFDLDLEALMDPAPFEGYEYANYHWLVSRWKNLHFPSKAEYGDFYISSAPQCVIPDARLADAISKAHFDFIFVQFYNTKSCSARKGFEGLDAYKTDFTFDDWVKWLNENSKVNPNVKLYLGLPADKLAAPGDQTSYLEPTEANDVISFYKKKHPSIFGGVMLWEATWNSKNTCSGTPYSTNIKAILGGSYKPEVCPTPSSSIAPTSSAIPTPTAISEDGTCGPDSGYTCAGSQFGDCCSKYNYCGSGESWCAVQNCQPLFGNCGMSSSSSVAPTITSSAVVSSSSAVVSSSSAVVSSSSAVLSSSSTVLSSSSATLSSSSSAVPSISTSSAAFPEGNSTSVAFPSGTAPISIPSVGPISTGPSAIVTSSVSVPFPIGNTSVVHPSGTGVASISIGTSIGTGASSNIVPSISAPFPTGNSSVVPSSSGSVDTSLPATTDASSSIVTAPFPTFNVSRSANPTAASSSSSSSSSSSGQTSLSAGEGGAVKSSQSSSGPGYPVYTGPGYPVKSPGAGEGQDGYSAGKASVTDKPGHAVSSPAGVTTTCYETTYVDLCSTGLTTLTATVTKTYAVCANCVAPTPTPNEIPEGWYTTVAVWETVTATLTKPYTTPTGAAYQPAKSPAAGVPGYNAASSVPTAEVQSPSQGKGESNPQAPAAYVPETVSKVYVVAVPASEMPGNNATPTRAPYIAGNGTAPYAPTGTASSTVVIKGAAAYTGLPAPSQEAAYYEGAARKFSVGVSGLAVLVAGIMLL